MPGHGRMHMFEEQTVTKFLQLFHRHQTIKMKTLLLTSF